MKPKLSDKQIKRIAKSIKGWGPPEHTDEELGAGEFAGPIGYEGGNPSIEDAMEDLQEAISWFGNAMLESLPEGVSVENITGSDKWQQLLSSLRYTVEVMEGKYR